MKRISLDFAPNGTCRIEAFGYEGSACLNATEAFERALGGVQGERIEKPEMAAGPPPDYVQSN